MTLLTAQRTYFRVNLTYLDSLCDLAASTIAIEGLMLSGGLGPDGGTGGDVGTEPGPIADAGLLRGYQRIARSPADNRPGQFTADN